jgi:hypothetical protein
MDARPISGQACVPRRMTMSCSTMRRMAARLACRCALCLLLGSMAGWARAAALDESDITQVSAVTDAIRSLEEDVSRTLHDLPQRNAEEIEAYSYIGLNLESAQERLNSVFLLAAVSIYMESATDQMQILNLMGKQILPASRTFLFQKSDAIASMAVSHPGNRTLADYSMRAGAILNERAVPMLDALAQKIGAVQP